MTDFAKRWGPALLVMAVIFIGSSISSEEIPQYNGAWDFIIKKSGHLLEYGVLAARVLRGLAGRGWGGAPADAEAPGRGHLAAAVLLAALYGVTDEFHQRFTPGRGARPLDVAIDILGASLGLALVYAWRVIRQTRSQSPQSRSTHPRA